MLTLILVFLEEVLLIDLIVVLRDTQERSLTLENSLNRYLNFVKPGFEEFVLPTKKYADIIVPRGSANERKTPTNQSRGELDS